MQEGLVAGAFIAFVLGWWTQNMQLCMLTFLASVLLVAIVTVPAWGFYKKHEVEWLPATAKTESTTEQTTEGSTEAGNKGGRKTITVKTSITTTVS